MFNYCQPMVDFAEVIINSRRLYEGNLEYYLWAFFKYCRSLDNGYHNGRHPLHLLWLGYDACRYYHNQLSPMQMREQLIAHLWHDFNHSGIMGDGNDDLNITAAKRALKKYLDPDEPGNYSTMAKIIGYSQWPHLEKSRDLPLAGQIIRDADMMQGLEDAWIHQVIHGISVEMGQPHIVTLSQQAPFLQNLTFCTDWAKQLVPREDIEKRMRVSESLYRVFERQERRFAKIAP